MFLLDTNICIFIIKKKKQKILDKLKKNMNKGLFISSLTLAELEFGIENSEYKEKNRVSLIEFLSIFEILPFEQSDARAFGMIKADLKKSGHLIGSIDTLLAAQALSRNFVFITNNTREFNRVKNLKLEDWSL